MTEGSDPTMTCGAGAAFDQTPTCEGSPAESSELCFTLYMQQPAG